MTLKFNRVCAVVKIHVRAKCHQAKCSGSWVIMLTNFLLYLALAKNPKIGSCDLDLWPWNPLGFKQLSRYMFVQNSIKLSAAVHELTPTKTIQSITTARTVTRRTVYLHYKTAASYTVPTFNRTVCRSMHGSTASQVVPWTCRGSAAVDRTCRQSGRDDISCTLPSHIGQWSADRTRRTACRGGRGNAFHNTLHRSAHRSRSHQTADDIPA